MPAPHPQLYRMVPVPPRVFYLMASNNQKIHLKVESLKI
jgi:hypothetical protein